MDPVCETCRLGGPFPEGEQAQRAGGRRWPRTLGL